jgi:hypothetical protein
MFGRFCLNRTRQSDHENRGRHFRLGADYDRIEIYSDAVLVRSEFSRPAPDPATTAVAHAALTVSGVKSGDYFTTRKP